MYWVCDFLYMAAQIFVAIGLISAVSEPKRERNVEFIVNVLTIVLIAVLNTYNNSSNNGLFSNAMLLIIVAFISLSSWGLYRGRYWDVFFTYATFFSVVAIGDFFMLTCAYFILDYLNLPLDLFLRVNMYRGTYLLLYAVVVLCFGKLLKRGLTARKVSLCHFEFKSYVLVVLLWCCLIYFQRIYKLVVPEAFMRQWWLFLLTVVVMSLGFGGRMVKEKRMSRCKS